MFGWLKQQRQIAQQAEEQEKYRKEQRISKLTDTLKKKREKMLSSPCALNGMNNCSAQCVHFYVGFVSKNPDLYAEGFFPTHEDPKCKLWRE